MMSSRRHTRAIAAGALAFALPLAACSDGDEPIEDAGVELDTGIADAGLPDSGPPDLGGPDFGVLEAADPPDAGMPFNATTCTACDPMGMCPNGSACLT